MKTYLALAVTSLIAVACSKSAPNSAIEKKDALGANAAVAASSPAPVPKVYDGPFGLKQGLTLEEVRALTSLDPTDSPSLYSTAEVPAPHVAFERYVLGFSKKSGLCKVTGIGKDITAGSYGAEVISAFNELESALKNKYGRDKKYDFASGVMDEPQFWMMALSQKDRTLASFWDKESKSTLPPTLSSIALEANGSDINTAYINLSYEFSNIDDCIAETKEEKNKGL